MISAPIYLNTAHNVITIISISNINHLVRISGGWLVSKRKEVGLFLHVNTIESNNCEIFAATNTFKVSTQTTQHNTKGCNN